MTATDFFLRPEATFLRERAKESFGDSQFGCGNLISEYGSKIWEYLSSGVSSLVSKISKLATQVISSLSRRRKLQEEAFLFQEYEELCKPLFDKIKNDVNLLKFDEANKKLDLIRKIKEHLEKLLGKEVKDSPKSLLYYFKKSCLKKIERYYQKAERLITKNQIHPITLSS